MGARLHPALQRCLEAGGGLATTAELLAVTSRSALHWAVKNHLLARVHPQVHARGGVELSEFQRIRAVLMWARTADPSAREPPRATGPSALRLWELPVPDRLPVHIETEPTTALRSRPQVVVRRMQTLGALRSVAGMHVVPVERALVSSWCVLTGPAQRAPLFAAIRRRLTTTARIRDELSRWPRLRGRSDLLALLDLVATGCESELEFLARTIVFTGQEFARIDWQHEIEVRGHRFRLDGYDEATRTAVELDGDAFHATREQRRYDAERMRLLAEVGIHTVRFHFDDISRDPRGCRAQLRTILASRPHDTHQAPRGA